MPFAHDIAARLEIQFRREALKHQDAVASVAYHCDNAIHAGMIGQEKNTPAAAGTPDSRFLVMSITKSFTAVAVLRLVAAGQVELDGPLSQWMAKIPHASRITVRQCLQHTSGLPDYGQLKSYHEAVRRGDRPWTFDEFLDRTDAEKLLCEPGTEFRYSNIGYMLLRRLLEAVANRIFPEIIADGICKPLGLEQTVVIETPAELSTLIPGYSRSLAEVGSPEVDVRTCYDPAWIATGVVGSTAKDIVRFYQGLFTGALLPPALLREMCRLQRAGATHPRYVTPSYGLGLMADPDCPCGAMYGHNGAGPGYSASAFHFKPAPDDTSKDVTIAVLCNMENADQTESMLLVLADRLTGGR